MYEYYEQLKLPSYAPPHYVFYYVWMCLYFLMFVSFIILLFTPGSALRLAGLAMFAIQILLNFSWPLIFFKLKKIGLSCFVSFLLLMLVAFMTLVFFKMSLLLGILQIPYLVWLIFANILNFDVYKLNK